MCLHFEPKREDQLERDIVREIAGMVRRSKRVSFVALRSLNLLLRTRIHRQGKRRKAWFGFRAASFPWARPETVARVARCRWHRMTQARFTACGCMVISILGRLLAIPYPGVQYSTPVTPALLRLDPMLDPLRADPAFQKLCEEKQP